MMSYSLIANDVGRDVANILSVTLKDKSNVKNVDYIEINKYIDYSKKCRTKCHIHTSLTFNVSTLEGKSFHSFITCLFQYM